MISPCTCTPTRLCPVAEQLRTAARALSATQDGVGQIGAAYRALHAHRNAAGVIRAAGSMRRRTTWRAGAAWQRGQEREGGGG